jgi:hypothetical protein
MVIYMLFLTALALLSTKQALSGAVWEIQPETILTWGSVKMLMFVVALMITVLFVSKHYEWVTA